MKYRGLLFILALITFYCSSNSEVNIEQDFLIINQSDEKSLIRRGLIDQIADILEGVVSVTEDVLNAVLLPLKQLIRLDQDAIIYNSHKDEVGKVRLGSPICEKELDFRAARFRVIKNAQEKMFGIELDDEDVLEITFSGSGGGVRAKTFSLGACVGADKIGLLDTVMCMSGLSGTTWFLAPWISSGLSISNYREYAIEEICRGIDIEDIDDLGPMIDAILIKFAFNQHINIIDLYGGLLGNNFFRYLDKEQHMIYLSDQKNNIQSGLFPFPVYTAVLGERDYKNHWFEFTPFEIGSRWLGAYIPSWSFGRKFKHGNSTMNAPEMSLGFLMGVFGSAFAASFEEIYEKVIEDAPLPKWLEDIPVAESLFSALKNFIRKVTENTDLGDIRISWAQVFNYVYKMKECELRGKQDLKLVDAGADFNNPIFSTYRRPPYGSAPDAIFVFDASRIISIKQLKLAEKYASINNLPFPEIKNKDVYGKALVVYGDPLDLDIPLVFYLPMTIDYKMMGINEENSQLSSYANRLKDFDVDKETESGFANTFNFEYSKEQVEILADLAEFNIRSVEEKIKKVLKERLDAKRSQKINSKNKKG